jgi:hypothetical protein
MIILSLCIMIMQSLCKEIMQGEKILSVKNMKNMQGKGNILLYFVGILKVSGGRRSRCAREVLERVAVP